MSDPRVDALRQMARQNAEENYEPQFDYAGLLAQILNVSRDFIPEHLFTDPNVIDVPNFANEEVNDAEAQIQQ